MAEEETHPHDQGDLSYGATDVDIETTPRTSSEKATQLHSSWWDYTPSFSKRIFDEFNTGEPPGPLLHTREWCRKTSGELVEEVVPEEKVDPSRFWPEVWNAVSMTIPSIYAYYMVQTMPETVICSTCVYVLYYGIILHLPFSVSYHVSMAAEACGSDFFQLEPSVFRVLDMSFIHVAAIATSYAESRSIEYMLMLAFPMNSYSIAMLWLGAASEPRYKRFVRMGICVMIYLLPILTTGTLWCFAACICCWLSFSCMFVLSDIYMNGWGHVIMHAMLVPYTRLLMMNAMGGVEPTFYLEADNEAAFFRIEAAQRLL